ncbi:uncharacterized protein METZ01_LOCUS445085 [marine metagenome]|uniref:Lipoprotein n=1 Tax=marine metagenome TaxID=408172 RepID=A0A382Z9R5_9ZZZZ
MNNKLITITLIISMLFIGCATHIHTVGYGPQSGIKASARQYYLLWGLVPLNTVDTNEMAGTDINGNQIEDYEIQTQFGILDIAINWISLFTTGLFISSRTVTVTK